MVVAQCGLTPPDGEAGSPRHFKRIVNNLYILRTGCPVFYFTFLTSKK